MDMDRVSIEVIRHNALAFSLGRKNESRMEVEEDWIAKRA